MTRSAAALFGATLVGCTTVATFDMLATSDRDLFSACTPSLMDVICKDGDVVARENCLESRGAAYGQLHSPKMRRSWLIANGCPESTIDASPKPEAVAVAPPPAKPEPAPPPAKPAPPAPVATAAPPPAEIDQPPPLTLAKSDAPAALTLASANPTPPPEAAPAPAVAVARARAPEPTTAKIARPASLPAPPAGSFSDRERPETRERRLRDIIIAHGREMKGCVDRQLKLRPDLRADGLLVIEVDADGTVPRAELQGTDLVGTPLESCLRTIASRWRFPSSGRAYRIEAPLKVSGS